MAIKSNKYKIKNGQIVNIKSGLPIPENEPVFILRAKDIAAIDTLDYYMSYVENKAHKAAVADLAGEFEDWSTEHEQLMHEPD